MAKPLLLFVHGSGIYTDDWAAGHLARVNELAATFPTIAAEGAFTDQVEVVQVNYDTVFRDHIERWKAQNDGLGEFLSQSGLNLPDTVDWLTGATAPPDELSFFWTHVLDPVIYRGLPSIRDEVRAHVALQIVEAINRHLGDHPGAEISIIGHSLGTIVNHDVLHQLGSGTTGVHDAVLQSDRFQFANIFMVANASRLGPPELVDPDPYDSVVRPTTAPDTSEGLGGYCFRMVNFRNRFDPVPNWQRVDPQGWGNGYQEVEVAHVHQANLHGLIHYLSHPAVHVRIFRALLGNWSVSDEELAAALSAFQSIQIPCGAEIAALKNELDQIRAAADGRDLDNVISALRGFYRATQAARNACADLVHSLDGLL